MLSAQRSIVGVIGWVVVLLSMTSASQAQAPVHFSYAVKKVAGQKCELHITAEIDEGWHIYSQTQPEGAVSQPTRITCISNPLVVIPAGEWKEIGNKTTHTDGRLGLVQYQYYHRVEFVKTVTLKAAVKTSLSGTLTYQVCTDQMCLPPKDVPFMVALQ